MRIPNTVILVHGFTDSANRMGCMAKYLHRRGCTVLSPTLSPSNGAIPIENLAVQLKTFIAGNVGAGQRIDLVGFSMGGLICRYYLQRLGGIDITDTFIAISTPFAGTATAHFFDRPGTRQMRPRSSFLQDFEQDGGLLLEPLRSAVLYTPLDLTILPASSSIVSFAAATKFYVPLHFLMVYYPPVLKKVWQILNGM